MILVKQLKRQQGLNEKHKARLNNISLGIVRADNANGVTYWRVTSEPVRKEDATDLCSKLNKAGQDCIVKKAGASMADHIDQRCPAIPVCES